MLDDFDYDNSMGGEPARFEFMPSHSSGSHGPSGSLHETRKVLDQVPRSRRLVARQQSPIGLSLVQVEDIGLLAGSAEDGAPAAAADPEAAVAREALRGATPASARGVYEETSAGRRGDRKSVV